MATDSSTKSSSSSPTPGSTALDGSNTEGPNVKGAGNPTASNLGENPTGSTGASSAASSNAPPTGLAPAVGAADAAARGATSAPSVQAQALAAAITTALNDPKAAAPEAPSVAEQAKQGALPDPTELALKARGITGSGRRLDETIPGGLTVHPDGYWQNSEGVEVDQHGKVVEGGNKPRIDLSGARIQSM